MIIRIIGLGNVATSLHAAFARKGLDAAMLSSRDGLDNIPANVDVLIYAVRDEALEDVIEKVHVPARVLHLHTSGTMPISVFGADKSHAGILYPLQSFSKAKIMDDLSMVPFFIEARQIDDTAAIYTLALTLSKYIYETTQKDRERLHVAGVVVNNFTNLLYKIGEDLLKGTNIPFKALLPLIDETANKVHTLSPHDAQTGPAKRHDHNVIDHHEKLIQDEKVKTLYQLMSQMIESQY